MDNRIKRIKKTSRAVFAGLFILNILLLAAIIWSIVECARQNWDAPSHDIAKTLAFLILVFGVLLISAYIFYKINKSGTPFHPKVVKAMKLTALLVAFLIAIPDWVYQIVRVDRGLVLLSSNTFNALLFGAIVFCFALVFEYGCVLQTENDETL